MIKPMYMNGDLPGKPIGFVPVDDWNPTSPEDNIFTVCKGSVLLPITQCFGITKPELQNLNVFVISSKRCYNGDAMRDHLHRYMNYFEKFYDPDHELIMNMAMVKVKIDTVPVYDVDMFKYDQAASGADKRLPVRLIFPAQQQHLHRHARIFLLAQQTCRDDLRLVDDQRVVRVQIVNNIVEMLVLALARRAMHHHQAAVVARFDRGLRNQFFGQFIIKIGCFHNNSPYFQLHQIRIFHRAVFQHKSVRVDADDAEADLLVQRLCAAVALDEFQLDLSNLWARFRHVH